MRLPLTKSENIVLTIKIILLTLFRLCRLLLVHQADYIVNLSDFYSYRLIGKLTVFFSASGVQLAQTDRGFFHYHRTAYSPQLKSKCGSILGKVLRINLNLDGAPITSQSHTHPSHSQTSRLLTSSLSLGVPVPRPTHCMRGA